MPDTITVHELVLDLLQYIGVTALTTGNNTNALNRPGLIREDVNKALRAINNALGVIGRYGSADVAVKGRSSLIMRGPTQVIVNTTNEGGIVFTSGQEDWMLGCSILISGDAALNEITAISGTAGTLVRQYLGATATGVGATVYGDAAALDAGTKNVVAPVQLMPNRQLVRADGRDAFDAFGYQSSFQSQPNTSITKQVGWPILFLVEAAHNPLLNHQQVFMRVNPMPVHDMTVTFTSTRRFTQAVIADVGLTGTDPGTEFSGTAAEWAANILIPLARKQFMSHPAFKNREAKQEINEQAAAAISLLASNDLAPMLGPIHATYR